MISIKKELVSTITTIGFTKKTFVFRPEKENQVFDFKSAHKVYNKFLESVPENSKVVVRGLNILRDTTLKGFDDEFIDEDTYDDYTKGKVANVDKFKYFYNLTITVLEPNILTGNNKPNKVIKQKINKKEFFN
jgi:hypothetical protein